MYFSLITSLLLLPIFSNPSTPQTQNQLPFHPQSRLTHVHHALEKADIIPSILPDFTPTCTLSISFSKHKKHRVSLGNKLRPSRTKDKPTVWIACDEEHGVELGHGKAATSAGYTIALTDPDAPSRKDPKWSEMCHWIATGAGDLVEYKAPAPPKGTSYHRYIFVLLSGDNGNLTAPAERQHWGTGKERHGLVEWAGSQNLTVVGANFFYAKHE